MAKRLEYDLTAQLFSQTIKDDDGRPRLIGTDPALGPGQFFRWINESHGWTRREPWPRGPVDASPLEHKLGAHSSWPGSIPLPPRPVGRPKKELTDDDRMVSVSTSLRRAEMFEIMQRAANAKQTVSECVAIVLRAWLAHEHAGASAFDEKGDAAQNA